MASIEVILKDGTRRSFQHEGRPGGSYTKTVRYEVGFVVITDEYGVETAIPTDTVVEVKSWPTRW